MRQIDENSLDPEIIAQLDAIDATLAGEPVDPQFAQLAELALLLSADRPQVSPEFAASLDERIENTFRAPTAASRRPRRWFLPLAGLSAAAAAAVIAVVVIGSGSTSRRPFPIAASTTSAPSQAAASGATPATRDLFGASNDPVVTKPVGAAQSVPQAAVGAVSQLALHPPANGRKIVQSANLQLSTAPSRIEAVAQQVFDVIGREHGVVRNSTVSAGAAGYAQFQLSVPSNELSDTMGALSQLRYAHVAARTDVSQDVNNSFVSTTRRLADDRSLRTTLLKELARASTQQQIDSLNGRIHDAEASIARDEAALRSLGNKVNTSQISVSVNTAPQPIVTHHSGSFTLGRAVHDAGRVLTVFAGVALIALAALLPIALVLALGGWIAAAVRRRRREQALDLA
jgi:hypothetical protein